MNYTSMYTGNTLTALDHEGYCKHMIDRENGVKMANGKFPSCAEIIKDNENGQITYWVDLD